MDNRANSTNRGGDASTRVEDIDSQRRGGEYCGDGNQNLNQSGLPGYGDTRMNKAVKFKLEDPSMSLDLALIMGGFQFPSNATGQTLDNEGICLKQRKNQLLRRVRKANRQMERGQHLHRSSPGSQAQSEQSDVSIMHPFLENAAALSGGDRNGSIQVPSFPRLPNQGNAYDVPAIPSQTRKRPRESQETLQPQHYTQTLARPAAPESADPRLNVGLQLFVNQLHSVVYPFAMQQAGFSQDEMQVNSPRFQLFASIAMARESERLLKLSNARDSSSEDNSGSTST